MLNRRRTLQAITFFALVLSARIAAAQPFVYAAPHDSHVYVLNAGNALNLVAQIDLPSNQFANDVALGSQNRRLYIATSGSLVVVDTPTNTIVRTIAFPNAVWSVSVSADGQRIYVSREPAVVTVLRASDFANIGEVPVGIQPQHIALMPDESALYVSNNQSANVSVIDLKTFTTTTLAVGTNPTHIAIRPDGREAFVANSGSGTLSVIDTASRSVSDTVTVPASSYPTQEGRAQPYALAFSGDGSKLYVGDISIGDVGTSFPLRVMAVTTRTFSDSNVETRAFDAVVDGAAARAYVFGTVGTHFANEVQSIDVATDRAIAFSTASLGSGGGSIAVGNPGGCGFEISPKLMFFGPAGGSGTIDVPAPDGCSWTVTSSAAWLTAGVTNGSGAASVSYSVAANGGEPRSASITIAGQSVAIHQTVPQVWIDEPVNGTTINEPFILRGWAIDRDDTQTEDRYGTGIDAVNVYAYPAGGGSAIFVGRASTQPRSDIAAVYGFKYGGAGFTINVRGLPAGAYTLIAYAHSARTGSFTGAATTVTVTTTSAPVGVVDAPRQNDEVTEPFLFAGWAADIARASGTGVDAVNVYAYPASGGAPTFVGSAQYGNWPRPDVANYYQDSSLTPSGYLMLVSGLPIGRYSLVAYAHSTVTGQFFSRTVDVNIIGNSEAIMQVDLATVNGDRSVSLIGWAADRRGSSGNGIAAIQVWAYPDSGAAPVFVGGSGAPAIDRLEPRLVLGTQFGHSGWSLNTNPLATGGYRLVVYALSAVTGQFDAVRVVRVVIP